LDQFLFENPKRVLGRRVEAARVTMENPYILGPHLLAAAHEAPLDAEDEEYFGPAYRTVAKRMMEARALAASGGRLVYVGGDSPARDISLRSASSETVLISDTEGELIGTAEATRAPGELHPGATYLHRGTAYEIRDLDLTQKRAIARRVPNNYYTRPRIETDVEVLEELEQRDLANGATLHWGRVRTTDAVTYYKKIQVADEKEVGVFPLDLPDVTLETQAFWISLPPLPKGARPSFESFGGALHAGEHSLIGLLPLFAMCDRADIGGLSTPVHRQNRLPTVFVYDGYPGGVGISRRGYDEFEALARDTLGVITRCPCERGCPACIQSPKCGNWNEPLNKDGAVSFLRYLLGQVDNYPTL
jgi:DEAD/DEAH box helicase domain-containing protein